MLFPLFGNLNIIYLLIWDEERRPYLRSTAECVEHVEEYEAGEGHGRVTRRYLVVTHL